jgi:RNA polymerase sigma factor (sigma-70 family)
MSQQSDPANRSPGPEDLAFHRALRAGDPSAWTLADTRYGAVLRRRAAELLPRSMDPENAVGETWKESLATVATYDVDRPFLPWLLAICDRVCRRQYVLYRAQQRKAKLIWKRDHGKRHETQFEDQALVRRALATLVRGEAHVVSLRIFGRLTNREVAEACNMTPAAVRQTYSRALRHLRDGPYGEQLRCLADMPRHPRPPA